MSMFKKKAMKDAKIRAFIERINKGVYSVDSSARIKEVTSMHASRTVQIMSKKDFIGSHKAIVESMVENQQNRARLVAIKIECIKKLGVLTDKVDTFVRYTKAEFASQLNLEFSTQQAKNDAVTDLFSDAFSIQSKLKSVVEIIDLVIQDIDQSGWQIKGMIEMLKITVPKLNETF